MKKSIEDTKKSLIAEIKELKSSQDEIKKKPITNMQTHMETKKKRGWIKWRSESVIQKIKLENNEAKK